MQQYRSYVLPFAIILGLLFHSFIILLSSAVQILIFLMLFFTYSSIHVSKMRIGNFDLYLLLFQLVASILSYILLYTFDHELAQGALVCILAPTATSAVVIAVMLGGNLTTMGVYTLLSNLVVAFMAPIYFSFIGGCAKLSFWESFGLIFAKIAPVLILPFILAVSIQKFSPTLNTKILKLQFISFYLWALALTVVIAKIINFILNQQGISLWFMIGAGILALIICIIQFALGKYIGNRYGDKVAGGQSLGQKNTVLAIWMSQTYLNPISSIIPAIYVILQNVYNSYQLWKQDTNHRKQHG